MQKFIKLMFKIILSIISILLIISAILIECMCQLTYVRNPSDLNTPRIIAICLFFLGILIQPEWLKKENKNG